MTWYSSKRATIVTEINGMLLCFYHSTPVVSWDGESIILRSGGYETVTTKRRMNEVSHYYRLGFRVWQHQYVWFVTLPYPAPIGDELEENVRLLAATDIGDGIVSVPNKQVVSFTDGMTFLREL